MPRNSLLCVSLLLAAVVPMGCVHSSSSPTGPATRTGDSVSRAPGAAPLFDGMGSHRRKITTPSKQTQRYFDQGLTWIFAFNHDEAIRSFQAATAIDPHCAMAWWGIALANGPHINNPTMPPDRSQAAWEALQKAVALKTDAADVETALIEALSHRYTSPPPSDRKALDEAYATAMRDVWKQFPHDADVGTLFAESMMDLRPWDLWTSDGRPHPGTLEIVDVLKKVLEPNPSHIGALHLLIHAVEASPRPEEALFAADRLGSLVPISGHLTHMPAHIYARVGRWADASESNVRAMQADRRYRSISPKQGFYHVYMMHNAHFLAWSSMMEGRSAAAKRAARQLIQEVPPEFARANASMVDPFFAIEWEVLMRFGQWEETLRRPAPPEYFPITTAFWHFARGVALAATDKPIDAGKELDELRLAIVRVPVDAPLGNNRAHECMAIAVRILQGEIAFAREEINQAIDELEQGVKLEDALRYNEPPDWIQPVRHALGAFLLRAGQPKEAERVYRADLRHWPENGWSLSGLAQALRDDGRNAEAAQVQEQFRKAWSRADVSISASCLCAVRQQKR